MTIIEEKPLATFLESIDEAGLQDLYVISPFVTSYAADMVKRFTSRLGVELRLVTNLDPFQNALSFSDPAAPLLDLLDSPELAVKIRKCNQLHAKAYLAPGSLCLFGSSNLTKGGIETNIELNALVGHDDRSALSEVETFVREIWEKQSSAVTKKELRQVSKDWKENRKRLLSVFSAIDPEPALAGNAYQKVKTLGACRI